MNKISAIGVLCGLLLFPLVAFGASMIASGWGEAGVDGTYTQGADVNGFPSYSQGGFYICHMDINHTWEIGTDGLCIDGAGDPPVYYSDDVTGTPDGVVTWIANTGALPLEYERPASSAPIGTGKTTSAPCSWFFKCT